MKKILVSAALALGVLGLAGPAHADENDFGGSNPSNDWNATAHDVCLQELAVVPVLGDWVGDHANNCSTGNVIGAGE